MFCNVAHGTGDGNFNTTRLAYGERFHHVRQNGDALRPWHARCGVTLQERLHHVAKRGVRAGRRFNQVLHHGVVLAQAIRRSATSPECVDSRLQGDLKRHPEEQLDFAAIELTESFDKRLYKKREMVSAAIE